MRFLLDYISPYAYIAWTQVHALAERHSRTVEPVPVLFAAMLNANDTRGPAEIPAKRLYTFKDVLRTAAHLDLPLTPPAAHPFNPLLALRVTALPMPEPTRKALIDRLFKATWGGGSGVTDRDVVDRIAAEVGVSDAAERASSPSIKQQIRDNTSRAIAEGVFGVPTVQVDGELFWGYDSFCNIDRFLSGATHIDPDVVSRWIDLPAAARRR
ncbi:MAG: 2-hydroxychromene-2-carboxylate isomerase [Myxococcota bacterium]|nr:2-hydroxychromene-2-carboxylate isomerase [Myxococcota bacterium]